MLDDLVISEAIVKSFMEDFIDSIKLDVAIVGAGPAGLMAGYCLAKKGRKVVIFERKLSIDGNDSNDSYAIGVFFQRADSCYKPGWNNRC